MNLPEIKRIWEQGVRSGVGFRHASAHEMSKVRYVSVWQTLTSKTPMRNPLMKPLLHKGKEYRK